MILFSRVIPGLFSFNNILMFSTTTCVGFYTLIPIDLRWYWSITDSLEAFLSAVNLAPNVEVYTTFWRFYDHGVGVYLTI